ncbi:MAG TPA: arsenosugar biosynthesis radical SAM (seleno)protein ArsS [Acidobacteriota bacterium]|jgi:radical SAM/Cys-rich protein|nr:arsenosugar biosynthesis radical SAM (seleno)protein ArsS [Acidobacteriota bacterium]
MNKGSLLQRQSPLASTDKQVHFLESTPGIPSFEQTLSRHGHAALHAAEIEIFQINVGKLCNQTCGHCHVDAGPDRTEVMSRETAEACMRALARTNIPKVDITGGAPELNPNFRWLVAEGRCLGRHVMDRCNLTVLHVKGQEDLAEFLARHGVEVICSLPYYQERETDKQRGIGVFQRSIDSLKTLNALGYGEPGSQLILNLVYNPVGAFIPASQKTLEQDFKRNLYGKFGIQFNSLYCITNMPISRFLEFLIESGNYERYMERLVQAFNPAAVNGLMCRNTISIGWDGRVYDCDFNQMLDLAVGFGAPRTIFNFDIAALNHRRIATGKHCYGCTAGAGSSCGGATT